MGDSQTASRLIHYRQRLSIRNRAKVFQGRDDGALRSLLTVLLTRGLMGRQFLVSDALFNDPSELDPCEQERIARGRFGPDNLLIRTTRFGMDDWHPQHATDAARSSCPETTSNPVS